MGSGAYAAPKLLLRLQSLVTPEIFSHPIWIEFIISGQVPSSQLIQDLLDSARQYEIMGDILSCCQIFLLCASLQKSRNQHDDALNSLRHVLKLADNQKIPQFRMYALWALAAINLQLENYRSAKNYLSNLQRMLYEIDDWVLGNVITLLTKSIKNAEEDEENIRLVKGWLVDWGNIVQATPGSFWPKRGNKFRASVNPILRKFKTINRFYLFTKKAWAEIAGFPKTRSPITMIEHQPSGYQAQMEHELPKKPDNTGKTLKTSGDPSDQVNRKFPPYSPSLAVYCLGRFQAYQDDRFIENWLSRKALTVFKYLLIQHPTPVGKEILMDTIWPDADMHAARRNLHQAIYSLRQTLRGDQHEFLHIWFDNNSYFLNPELEVWLDFRAFEKSIQAARRLEQDGLVVEAIGQYGIAEGLYQGDFLAEDLYEDWPIVQREHMLNLYLSTVDRLSELYQQNEQYAAVVHLCHKVLAKDRCYEAAHRRLMYCYMVQGQRHLAVRQYQTCILSLREELNIPASEETVALYDRIMSKRDA